MAQNGGEITLDSAICFALPGSGNNRAEIAADVIINVYLRKKSLSKKITSRRGFM
jgi:hypothetical protein